MMSRAVTSLKNSPLARHLSFRLSSSLRQNCVPISRFSTLNNKVVDVARWRVKSHPLIHRSAERSTLIRAYSQAPSGSDNQDPIEPTYVYPAEDLLQSLELTANTDLPKIPSGQDKEHFWRAYLLANQIILYLAARPPAEVESFSAVIQSAVVDSESAIGRGRSGIVKITQKIVDTMSTLPLDSPLRTEHLEVIQAYEKFGFLYQVYSDSVLRGDINDIETWSRFFTGIRTELIEFTVQIGKSRELSRKNTLHDVIVVRASLPTPYQHTLSLIVDDGHQCHYYLIHYSLACREAYEDVSSYFRRTFSIYTFLSPYFSSSEEIDRFRMIQKVTGALIAGHAALEFFGRLAFDPGQSSLEIFVQHSFALVIANSLESSGYHFTEDRDREGAQDQSDSSVGVHQPSFSTVMKRNFHTTLGLLDQSYRFEKQVGSQRRRIYLKTSNQIPLEVVLDRSQSISLYPRTTFEHRLSVLFARHVDQPATVEEQEWRLLGYEDLKQHQLAQFLPYHVRRVGDEHCWMITLPTSRDLRNDDGNEWNRSLGSLFDEFTSWSFYPHAGVKRIRTITWSTKDSPRRERDFLFWTQNSDPFGLRLQLGEYHWKPVCKVYRTGAFGNGSTILGGTLFQYSTNLTVGGSPFQVYIDTGSSDLWVSGNITKTQNTSVPVSIGYAIGSVTGHVQIAEVMFDGFTIPDQAYILAEQIQASPTAFDGILGLGPSNSSNVFKVTQDTDVNGAPIIDRIFVQNTTVPNFISFTLERFGETPDNSLLQEQFGQFTIGEVIPEYQNVTHAPHLPALVDQFGVQHWQTLLDPNGVIGPDGERINTTTDIPSPTDGSLDQLHVLPHDLVDAIYGRVPGAEFIVNGSDAHPSLGAAGINNVWKIPCEYGLNVSFLFSGVEIPISPLDLTLNSGLQDPNGVDICIALYQQISPTIAGNMGFGAVDAILGPSFLRNVYTLIDFGDFVDGSNEAVADPYISLLPTLNREIAHQDFVNQRLNGSDITSSQAPLLPLSQMRRSPYMGGSFAAQIRVDGHDDHGDDLPWYKRIPVIVGISIGGAILLLGLIAIIFSIFTRRRRQSKVPSESPFVPPMGSYKPLFDVDSDVPRNGPRKPLLEEDLYRGHDGQYTDTDYHPPKARDVNDEGTVKYDPPSV
ncbi:hypothetical protein K435DRAFT_797921 [Dendrothele bispora CBS 962.96]|uniref:Peptidase A1 domain-containing protein n=1 Tax=Dendrothele bispora (strain CBS 962.96) TaxID=1314807 RepID=A0A4S8M0X1_DENBC|nr:hypothetical protein K435DRAFT_797921 [Dendrothele bispora CBS 962.96]